MADGVGSGGGMYYSLHMDRFLSVVEAGKKWRDIGLTREKYGVTNESPVRASTSDICESNSADSYLALVVYTLGRGQVITGDGPASLLNRVGKVMLAKVTAAQTCSSPISPRRAGGRRP